MCGIQILLRLAQGRWPPPDATDLRLERFKAKLQSERLRPGTVRQYLEQARLFLTYLDRQQIQPENVKPEDVDAFIESRLRSYHHRHGRSPRRFVHWRCEYTRAIHRLLRYVQGEWPPVPSVDPDLARFGLHLAERGLQPGYIRNYCLHADQFVQYLKRRGIEVARVQPSQVAAYFRVALRLYKKRKPNLPNSSRYWRMISGRSVQALLRFVQGEWPPGSRPAPVLGQFRAHPEQCGYSRTGIPSHVSAVRQFLLYLKRQSLATEEVRPSHLASFLQTKLERYRKRSGRSRNPHQWQTRYTGAIRRLLRMVHSHWPPSEPPTNDCERFQREVCDGYGRWLTEVQGLAEGTLRKNGDAARLFLRWLGERATRDSLSRLTVSDIDKYLEWRMPGLRRATRHGVTQCLRSFLRYLQGVGLISRDLSSAVSSPILYKFDEIPRSFTEQQVKKLLEVTRRDRSPSGRRDYAILMLLATYGLRAGEVVRLRLEDIDWRGERLRVRQSKTGVESFLPLVTPIGDALLNYLRCGRPHINLREVFLRVRAPQGPFSKGSSLGTLIHRRLKQAGIEVRGRHGAHAFRFARAASLLRASVPLKSIGDLLGHRSAVSTEIYLRLPTDDLRAISLEVPGKGAGCRSGRTNTSRS